MSWVRIKPVHAHNRSASGITIAIRSDKRQCVVEGRVFASLKIGPTAADSFGWRLGDKVDMAWGADEHAGFVRLEKSKDGYTLRRKGKSANESFTIEAVVPGWITQATSAEACGEPTPDGAAMVLPLPARFKDLYQVFQRARDQGRTASLDPDQPVAMPATASQDARASAEPQHAAPSDVSISLPVRETASIAGDLFDAPARLMEIHGKRGSIAGAKAVSSQREVRVSRGVIDRLWRRGFYQAGKVTEAGFAALEAFRSRGGRRT